MKKLTKTTYKIFWQHVKKYKFAWFSIILLTALESGIKLLPPIFYSNFFNILSADGEAIKKVDELINILYIILGIWGITWTLSTIAKFTNSWFQTTVMRDLSNSCFKKLHEHSFGFFQNNFVGSLVKKVNRYSRSFETIDDLVKFTFLKIFIQIGAIIVILMYKNFWIGFGILIWAIVILFINYLFSKYKLKYDYKRSQLESKTTGVLADTITNYSNVKLFSAFKKESKNFYKVSTDLRDIRKFTWNLSEVFEVSQILLMVLLEFGIMYGAVILWKNGVLMIGDFVLIQSYILIIFHRLWSIGREIRRFYESIADAEEMSEIFDEPVSIKDVHKAKNLIVKKGKIEFKKVHFSYNKTRKIIKDFSITFDSGKRVALVGPSGAGKSTIIKSLLRQFDISRGKIFIDGQNTIKVKQESLRKNIGFVPQDPILFHRSIMDNIRYGRPSATDKEVFEAAKHAHCHEFIVGLKKGYDTFVGERGVKLSGGERQRVAIARAILKDAPILVLDEATSSLDSESEKKIQDALDYLMKNKTVIVIAHRLSTIMKMDRILVMDKGIVIEDGTHKSLLRKKNGMYKKLWNLQAGGFID